MSSREQQKREARERRQAAEQEAATTAQRRRRLQIIGGAAAVAVVVVAIAVIVSSGGGGTKVTKGKPASGGAAAAAMFAGIPQSNTTLGRTSAPVTLVQYVDLKCPACQAYELSAFPTIVRDWVKTGKVRIETRVQHIIGNEGGDSERAARMALAAGQQNKLFPFTAVFYRHQGNEAEQYVNTSFLTSIAQAVPGLNVDKALAARNSAKVSAELKSAGDAFDNNGFNSTPSFQIGTTGGTLKTFNPTNFADPRSFAEEFVKLLPNGGGGA
jgi:protein-disulfide isomerase